MMAALIVGVWLFSVYANYRVAVLVYQAFAQECYRFAAIGFAAWVGVHLILM